MGCCGSKKRNSAARRDAIRNKYRKVAQNFDEASFCFKCQEKFGMLNRRHHCRKCRHSFCNKHSKHRMPLDEENPEEVRVCERCYNDGQRGATKKKSWLGGYGT